MKTKDIKDLRELSPEDLTKKEVEFREEIFNLQMQRGTSQLKDPKRIKNVKRDIARIQTIVKEKQISEAAASLSEG